MNYPVGFPRASERSVEAARDKAELALRDTLANKEQYLLDVAFRFICDVWREFARQACEAERRGEWLGTSPREGVDSFLTWQLIPHAYELANVGKFFPAAFYEPLSLNAFRERVLEKFKKSDVWSDYLKARSVALLAPLNATTSTDLDPSAQSEVTALPTSETRAERASRRMNTVKPVLEQKGLTRSRWATKAGVDPKSVYEYLGGKTLNLRPDNANALAEAIGLKELPE